MIQKRALQVLLSLIFLLCVSTTTQATESEELSPWDLSEINLDHKTIEFQIDGVEYMQTATLVLESTEEIGDKIEIPFLIQNESQKFVLEIPGTQFIRPNVYYDIYVMDGTGKQRVYISYYSRFYHYGVEVTDIYPYPAWVEIYNRCDRTQTYSVTTFFQTKSVTLLPYSSGKITYSNRLDVGTVIEVKWTDGYGCEGTRRCTVTDQLRGESIPSLDVWRESITLQEDVTLKEDVRLVASVGDKLYYSDYGFTGNKGDLWITYPAIPRETGEIDIWMENRGGASSPKEEHDIRACLLKECERQLQTYMTKTSGTIFANSYGQKITKVSTERDGKTYSCIVSENGQFELSYPRTNLLDIVYEDEHGCVSGEHFGISNTCDEYPLEKDFTVLIEKAYKKLKKGERLAVQIQSKTKTYYSPYAPSDGYVAIVQYPKQKEGEWLYIWVENENGDSSLQHLIRTREREFEVSENVKVNGATFVVREYEGSKKIQNDLSAYVVINGKKYNCKRKIGGKTTVFSVKYPKKPFGTKVKFTVADVDKYQVTETYKLKNKEPDLKLSSVDTSTTKISGKTEPNSKIVIKIGKKKYKATADKKGKFSVGIKAKKYGTTVSVSVTTPDKFTTNQKTKIKKVTGDVVLTKYIFKDSTSIPLKLKNMRKGDVVKITVGSNVYKKEITSDKKSQYCTVGIKQVKAGSKIDIELFNKFNQKKGATSSKVYLGDRIYIGMKASDVLLTTYGTPNKRNNYGIYTPEQWVYQFDDGHTEYVYISNGKVVNIQKIGVRS